MNQIDLSQKYCTIQGWMMQELGLMGNECIVFAIIYGYCQDKDGATREAGYFGSLSYLSKWTNIEKSAVSRILTSLVAKGMLYKSDYTDEQNQRRCRYIANFGFIERKRHEYCVSFLENRGCRVLLDNNGGVVNQQRGCCSLTTGVLLDNNGGVVNQQHIIIKENKKENNKDLYPPNPPRGNWGNSGNFPVSHGSFSENPDGSFEGQTGGGIQVSDGNPYGAQGSGTAMSARHGNADLEGLSLEWVNPSPVSTPGDVEKRKSSAKKKKDFAPVQGSLFGEPINNTTPPVKVAEKAGKGANNAKAYETAREFVRLWNEMAVQNGYPKVTALTDGRIRAVSRAIKAIKAECGGGSVDITALFGKIAKSDYLKANARNRQGNGKGTWFDFDWVVEPPKQGEPISNAVKIWLGRFDNAPMVQQTAPASQNGANAPKNRKLGGLDLMAEAMRIAERIDNGEIPQMLSDMGCDIYNTQTAPASQNGGGIPPHILEAIRICQKPTNTTNTNTNNTYKQIAQNGNTTSTTSNYSHTDNAQASAILAQTISEGGCYEGGESLPF